MRYATLFRWTPWAISVIALLLTGRGILAQAALQTELNGAMNGVLASVREAGDLTAETARALAPLASTSATLQTMNGRLQSTVSDLRAMNDSLARTLVVQERMMAGLAGLNRNTGRLITAMAEIDRRNADLLAANRALADQTAAQAGVVERLNGLTDEAVLHLRSLNRKLEFLRR